MGALAYYYQRQHVEKVKILIPNGKESLLRELGSVAEILSLNKIDQGLLVTLFADVTAIKEIASHCKLPGN
jgi:hypothetical protein